MTWPPFVHPSCRSRSVLASALLQMVFTCNSRHLEHPLSRTLWRKKTQRSTHCLLKFLLRSDIDRVCSYFTGQNKSHDQQHRMEQGGITFPPGVMPLGRDLEFWGAASCKTSRAAAKCFFADLGPPLHVCSAPPC